MKKYFFIYITAIFLLTIGLNAKEFESQVSVRDDISAIVKNIKSLEAKEQKKVLDELDNALKNTRYIFIPSLEMCIGKDLFEKIFEHNYKEIIKKSTAKRLLSAPDIGVLELIVLVSPLKYKEIYLTDSMYTCHLLDKEVDRFFEMYGESINNEELQNELLHQNTRFWEH